MVCGLSSHWKLIQGTMEWGHLLGFSSSVCSSSSDGGICPLLPTKHELLWLFPQKGFLELGLQMGGRIVKGRNYFHLCFCNFGTNNLEGSVCVTLLFWFWVCFYRLPAYYLFVWCMCILVFCDFPIFLNILNTALWYSDLSRYLDYKSVPSTRRWKCWFP